MMKLLEVVGVTERFSENRQVLQDLVSAIFIHYRSSIQGKDFLMRKWNTHTQELEESSEEYYVTPSQTS